MKTLSCIFASFLLITSPTIHAAGGGTSANSGVASISSGLTTRAADSKYDPYLLASNRKSEYTSYLKNIFDRAKHLSIKTASAPPNLIKGSPGYKFRSEIKRQTKENKINFAGEWTLVVVGCGTACSQYFLVHSETGKVIDPHLITTNGNPLFVKNKNILVTSGSDGELTLTDAKKGVWGGPKAWRWNGKSFEEISL